MDVERVREALALARALAMLGDADVRRAAEVIAGVLEDVLDEALRDAYLDAALP